MLNNDSKILVEICIKIQNGANKWATIILIRQKLWRMIASTVKERSFSFFRQNTSLAIQPFIIRAILCVHTIILLMQYYFTHYINVHLLLCIFFIKTLLKWNDRLIYIKYIDPNWYNTYPLFSNQLAGWVSFNADLIIVPQDISRVFQGLLRSDPRTIKDKASFTRLWIHEVSRVISDKLVDSNDREQFLGIVNYQLAKYFDTTYQLIVPFPPLVFCEWQC